MTEIDLDVLLLNHPVPGYEGVLGLRHKTVARVSMLLNELAPKVLVETGCQHTTLLDAHGASTLIFGALARKFDALLFTIDIDESRLQECRRLTGAYADHIRYVRSESVAYLSRFNRDIDFLYLDSLDFHPGREERSRLHQLWEIRAAYNKLRHGSLVLLDDAYVQLWFSRRLDDVDVQGKTYYTHRFLLEKKAECLIDIPNYQRLYRIRKGP